MLFPDCKPSIRPLSSNLALLVLAFLVATSLSRAQNPPHPVPVHKIPAPPSAPRPQNAPPAAQENFQQHYDAARTFQVSGDQERAATEYGLFLSGALRSSAKATVELGETETAVSLFEQALKISPNDAETGVDYGHLLLRQDQLTEARSIVEKVIISTPDNAKAQALLGQILFAQKDYKGAREHLEHAVVAAPDFDSAYLLGITYVKLSDFGRAALVFDDLIAGFGDTARMHMMIGLAYKEGGWEALDSAILQLQKALTKDPRA
jgi:tetratricopeptide (TPR) repeat protein